MEKIRKLMPWKKVGAERDCPSWRRMCSTWYKIVYSDWVISHDFSSPEYKDWNPWKDWCQSWEEFQSSEGKVPKSERRKAAMFSELYTLAKVTRDKLQEAMNDLKKKTKENETLTKQNLTFGQKCEELQRILDAEKWRMNEKERLIESNLEKEVNQKEILQVGKQYLEYRVGQLEEELEKVQDQCKNLEEKVFSLQSQLVKCSENPTYQFIRNDITIYGGRRSQPPQYRQLENGETGHKLDLDAIRDIVDRLGQVNSFNVFDWLCSCEEELKIQDWMVKDFEQVLRRCMDSSSFASLLTMVRMRPNSWLDICKYMAEIFIPNLHNVLDTERMREDDNALRYLHRKWMIYRITESSDHLSRDDRKYKNAVCNGLLPHLYDVGDCLRQEQYEVIQRALCLAEQSLLDFEKKRKKARKAGAGCPSRRSVWKRLERLPVPYEEIHEASYWDLLVQLSRYEDLETGEPI